MFISMEAIDYYSILILKLTTLLDSQLLVLIKTIKFSKYINILSANSDNWTSFFPTFKISFSSLNMLVVSRPKSINSADSRLCAWFLTYMGMLLKLFQEGFFPSFVWGAYCIMLRCSYSSVLILFSRAHIKNRHGILKNAFSMWNDGILLLLTSIMIYFSHYWTIVSGINTTLQKYIIIFICCSLFWNFAFVFMLNTKCVFLGI